jgi:16S rRNA (cytosine967-C5)-methyltransferase
LYCTCSVLPQENDEVIARFAAAASGTVRVVPPAQLLPAAGLSVPDAQVGVHGVQLLPGGKAGTDGFYYACLDKVTSGTP